ncbi:MAG: ABC transporter ATP-binding protein [Kiritimatiellia bacterium]
MITPLLKVKNLEIAFHREGVKSTPVRSLSLTIAPGERVAIVGESGCGKSLTALALTGLPPTDRASVSGEIVFDGRKIQTPADMRRIRGKDIAYVFQDPGGALNPVMRVRDQIAECLPRLYKEPRRAVTLDLLTRAGLSDPSRVAAAYPCELSGGQQQRVMLAMALASQPKLLVADEPTTALDVTTQQQVLNLIDELAIASGMAVLLITHNLGLVAGHTARVHVMYAGVVVESGAVRDVLSTPLHPYASGLLAAVPMLDTPRNSQLRDIPGTVPAPDNWPPGCAFAPRCSRATPQCAMEQPPQEQRGTRNFRCFNPVQS